MENVNGSKYGFTDQEMESTKRKTGEVKRGNVVR